MKIPLNKNTMSKEERKPLIKVFDSGYMTMGKKPKSLKKNLLNILMSSMQ